MIIPTPAPTPSPKKTAQPSWNQLWNQTWNQAWNAGFNNPNGYTNSNAPGYSEGFSVGQAEYKKRNAPASTSNPIPSSTPPTPPSPTGVEIIKNAENNGNSLIDSDYENTMGMLGGAEQGLRGQAATATSQIDTGFGASKNEILSSQALKQQTANQNLATGEKSATQTLQQERDLFRQNQNINNAQLSALGISSSSVTEALAEKLGVDTARRIAGVTGDLAGMRQRATEELGRIKTYYQNQLQNLTQQTADYKAQINNSLIQGLNQINAQRGQAALAKSQARADLLQKVQSSIYSLTQQQQQFQQSLDLWKEQKTAAIKPIATDSTWFDSFVKGLQDLRNNPQTAGLDIGGTVNQNTSGLYSGSYNFTPKKNPLAIPEDPNNPGYDLAGNKLK